MKRAIDTGEIREAVKNLLMDVNYRLSPDVAKAITSAEKAEKKAADDSAEKAEKKATDGSAGKAEKNAEESSTKEEKTESKPEEQTKGNTAE